MTQAQHIVVVDDEQPAREMVGDYLKHARLQRDAVRRRRSLRASIAEQTCPT